jgi:hypothetical protein
MAIIWMTIYGYDIWMDMDMDIAWVISMDEWMVIIKFK